MRTGRRRAGYNAREQERRMNRNSTRPANLIFFLSDNHARQASGCYGHPFVKTPHLDRLAFNGVTFANAYCASPLCCPSRASLATGRYPHQTGFWDNAIAYDGTVPSWMHRLREQRYTVVSIGKLHFRSGDDDNGFSEEVVPMHLAGGRGAVKNLLRGFDAEPPCEDGSRWDLYAARSGAGTAHYQDYDTTITAKALEWLRAHARDRRPWVLFVSYASPHPPFAVPQRLLDLYPERDMPLPPCFRPGERSRHPSLEYLRATDGLRDMTDEAMLKRVAAAYFGLITFVDEQIGTVLGEAEALGLTGTTRILYTSDHGELLGAHGVFGKKSLYEGAVGVPLILAGPSVPCGRVVRQCVSHVDLFPTLIEAMGAQLTPRERDLPGLSLWPAVTGGEAMRSAFAEYHAQGSRAGAFMLREENWKLIYHVGMPSQLFDLGADPHERHDLVALGEGRDIARRLERRLRTICDPEAVDRQAKADQRAKVAFWGGVEQVRQAEQILYSPPPGLP
jgi:choline-sulfatase